HPGTDRFHLHRRKVDIKIFPPSIPLCKLADFISCLSDEELQALKDIFQVPDNQPVQNMLVLEDTSGTEYFCTPERVKGNTATFTISSIKKNGGC
ncbi:MAG: hypothetical protein ACFFD4_09005, partial [Candidatus Odinarchaeota archaeon]